ncbi:hypothetical protein [Solibacillus sp. CAU 1738]
MKKKLSKLLLVSLLTISVAAPVSANKGEVSAHCVFGGNLCSLIK